MVLVRSWYHIWDFFFSCANYQVQEETMGLFLALENLQWANNYHQASF